MPPNAPPDSGGPSRSGSLRGLDRRRTQPSENPRHAPRTKPSFRISRSSTQVSQQAKGPELQPDTCSSYDLPMDDLRGFLEKRFPECTFEKITHIDSTYTFNVPYPLTKEDHVAIDVLRKNDLQALMERSANSPESGET
ncbi:hypothetical protein V495_00928 [Pseudogymnoascus sp. VKM F-4514 (FW-929)]|nr:hypothetical protein V495_00928 [Pseudogymnoascus sp. VKM F-4514 (FW-929)]KFY60414.1 hypothetical protein V497_03647 [Pseudogymnoascus sp. VKM F-4516 (FW-969)]